MWIIPKSKELSVFVVDMGALTLESPELPEILEQSAMWRSNFSQSRTWSQRLKKVGWMKLLSGRILKPSRHKSFLERYTASLEAIPASRSLVQGNDEERKTRGIYGLIFGVILLRSDLCGASLRMLKATCPSDSSKSSETWKSYTTRLRQEYSQRLKSALLTGGNDCSSWRTPETGDSANRTFATNSRGEPKLSGQVKANWPSPDCSDRRSANSKQQGLPNEVKNWLTPRVLEVSEDYEKYLARMQASPDPKNNTKKNCGNLSMQVRSWPTASARDWKDTPGMSEERPDRASGRIDQLARAVYHSGQPGLESSSTLGKSQESWPTPNSSDQYKSNIPHDIGRGYLRTEALEHKVPGSKAKLNPRWVEQLMGIPVGWTNPLWPEQYITNRVDELRMCGNGVLPDTAEKAFRVLSERI